MTQAVTPLSALTPLDWTWRDQQIRYTVQGEGQPLLLIHGFGASIGHWKHNIPALAAHGYQVFALDLLGFGASAKPAWDYSLDLWQDLLRDFWQAKIQQPTVFVGNSIGGLLSLAMLANYPDLCAGGVLINCAGGLNHRPDELALPLRVVMGTFAKLVSSRLTGPFIFNQVRQKSRIKNTLYQVYGDRQAVTDELVEMLYEPSCDPGAQQVFASVITAPPGIARRNFYQNGNILYWCFGAIAIPGHRSKARKFTKISPRKMPGSSFIPFRGQATVPTTKIPVWLIL